ncbi:hypothetical protein Scep_021437 [Stephania cephalantha]|uniref:Secreted protein n=1 Tax=Stephania cephalantha TaxID=152367 RepID=A0AAP0HWV0_9MAGN
MLRVVAFFFFFFDDMCVTMFPLFLTKLQVQSVVVDGQTVSLGLWDTTDMLVLLLLKESRMFLRFLLPFFLLKESLLFKIQSLFDFQSF